MRVLSLLIIVVLPMFFSGCADPHEEGERGFIQDFGGREILIIASWHYLPFVTGSPVPPEDNALRTEQHRHIQHISAGYNITLNTQVVRHQELLGTLRTAAAAGRAPADLVWIGGDMIFPAITGDLVYALEEFPAVSTPNLRNGAYFANMHWSFKPRHIIGDGAFLGVNLELLRQVLAEDAPDSLPDNFNPELLLERGEWDFYSFMPILRRLRAEPEIYGISGASSDIIAHLIAANGGGMVQDFRFAYDSPQTLRALELAAEILRYDWYAKDTWHDQHHSFLEGRSVFFPLTLWTLDESEIAFDFTIVPFPAGPYSQAEPAEPAQPVEPVEPGGPAQPGASFMRGFEDGMIIPRWVNNPEEVLTVYNAIFDWAGYRQLHEEERARVRGLFRQPAVADRAINIVETQGRFDLGLAIPTFDWVNHGFADMFINENTVPFQAAEIFRSPQQALLDQVLEGWVVN